MSKHYVDKRFPELGYYEVFTGPAGSRWKWSEIDRHGQEHQDCGQWETTAAAAYRDAARDWEDNGNSATKRLPGQLRAAATRAEKESA